MTAPIDVDSLPPTQRLILEVLAARYRTGESCWSFSTRDRQAIEALVKLGLVDSMGSPAPKTIRARLTDAGRTAVVISTYEPTPRYVNSASVGSTSIRASVSSGRKPGPGHGRTS